MTGVPEGAALEAELVRAVFEAASGTELELEQRVQAALRQRLRRRVGSRPVLQVQVVRVRREPI